MANVRAFIRRDYDASAIRALGVIVLVAALLVVIALAYVDRVYQAPLCALYGTC